MSQRQLTVAKDSAYLWSSTLLALVFVAAAQLFFLSTCIGGILAADMILASIYGVASLLFLWATGSIYFALPLNLYFHSKYRSSDSNYARVDMVHRRVLNLLKKLPFRRHLSIAVSISNLGILRLCQGYYESAAELFSEAESYLKSTKGAVRNMSMIIFYNNLAVAQLRQNQCIEAELVGTKALGIAELPEMQKKYKKLTGPPLSVLAAVSLRLNELDRSMEYAKRALDLYENAPNPSGYSEASFHQAKVFCLMGMALCALKQGKDKEGIQYSEQAMKMAKDSPQLLTTLALEPINLLANEFMNKQLFDRAEELLELSYKIGRESPYHPDAKQALSFFEKLLLLTNRNDEITDMRAWLRPTDTKLISNKQES